MGRGGRVGEGEVRGEWRGEEVKDDEERKLETHTSPQLADNEILTKFYRYKSLGTM